MSFILDNIIILSNTTFQDVFLSIADMIASSG